MAIALEKAPALTTRHVTARVQKALKTTPVVLVQGPRHSALLGVEPELGLAALEGQSAGAALALQVGGAERTVINLNGFVARIEAQRDPAALIAGPGPFTILELQRAPGLLVAIQQALKSDATPGRFLLTASNELSEVLKVQHAEWLNLPMAVVTLLPPSELELRNSNANWLDAMFAGQIPQNTKTDLLLGEALLERMLHGSHLECIARDRPRSRHAWNDKHLAALLDSPPKRLMGAKEIKLLSKYADVQVPPSDLSDLRAMSPIDKPLRMAGLLLALANGVGGISNYRQWGQTVDMDSKTTERYTFALEQLYLVRSIAGLGMDGEEGQPARFNIKDQARMVKAPKYHFGDSAMLGFLLDQNSIHRYREREEAGTVWNTQTAQVLETYVVSELLKQADCASGTYHFGHYRDHDQLEVDLVIANAKKEMVAIDIKARTEIHKSETRGIQQLAEKLGKGLKMGVMLYDGDTVHKLMDLDGGAPLYAVPVSSLWGKA